MRDERNPMNIRLRELRKSQGKSAQQVALATGISKNGINILETNPNNSPMVRTLVILADYYGVSLDYLAGRTDDPALEKQSPHGRWNFIRVDKARRLVCFECSECGALFELEMFVASLNYNYCPNCGVEMDGGFENG